MHQINLQPTVDCPPPFSIPQLKSFLGIVVFYHRHVPVLSAKLPELYKLLKNGVQWEWSEKQQHSFNLVKELITKAQVIHPFNPEADIEIMTDACQTGVGAVSYLIRWMENC